MAEKILVIDDEFKLRELLTLQLEKEGYEVESCSNGREGVEKVQQNPNYACILTDVRMPEMDGLQFLKESKAISPTTPVIVVTGAATVKDAVEALKSGAVALVEKPFDAKKIQGTVREVLSLRGKKDRKQLCIPYMKKKWTLEIPSKEELLSSVAEIFVKGLIDFELVSSEQAPLAREACQQALMNAHQHGNANNPIKRISINACGTKEQFQVSIQDEGEGFNPHEYIKESSNEEDWEKSKGLFKIFQGTSQVQFNAKGNQITLIFEKKK